jgi:tetratricopeptide (TPR) repeat protein
MIRAVKQPAKIRSGGFLKRCLLLLAVLVSESLYPAASPAKLTDYLQLPPAIPSRDITLISGGGASWKREWDAARRSWRTGDQTGAEGGYRKLLAVNAGIAEARWELAQVLIQGEQWEKARSELELLVETPPDRIDYLNALGLVLRHLGQFGRALEVFDRAHALAPENFLALVGLTQGLVEVGRKKEAFPLFKQVLRQKPDDRELQLALANLAFELGHLETARKQLITLAAAKDAGLDTLLMAARVHEGLGREQEAARYWERSLRMAPGNREAQGRLALYYENRGQLDQALAHLLVLLETNPQNTSLLSRICRIYVQTDRFAEALPYFERYVKLKPDAAPEALSAIVNIRTPQDDEQIAFFRRLLAISPDDLGVLNSLANELEAAGNPEGALFMWEHVARAVPGRVEIFRNIALLQEKMGREEQLVSTLETLHRLTPDDQEVLGRLARIQAARGELDSSLDYYDQLERLGYRGFDLFAGRAAIHLEKGRPVGALLDLQKLLDISPRRHDIRRQCLALAGELGEKRILDRLAEELEAMAPPGERGRDLLLLAEVYGQAGDFSSSVRYFQRVMANAGEPEEAGFDAKAGTAAGRLLMRQARLGLNEVLGRAGLVDEAEQVLRQGVLAGDEPRLFLERLFDLTLSRPRPDLGLARMWLSRYQQESGVSAEEIGLCRSRLLAAAGEFSQAEKTIRQLLYDLAAGGKPAVNQEGTLGRRAGLRLAEVLLAAGMTSEAEQQCLAMLGDERDPEVMILLQKIYLLAGMDEAAAKVSRQLVRAEADGIELLRLAELYRRHGLAGSQASAAATVLGMWPDSLRAGLLLTQALRENGDYLGALRQAALLAGKFPDCPAVNGLMADLYHLAGDYRAAGRQCDLLLEKEPGRLDISFLKLRGLLALGNREAAGKLVREVFPVAVGEIFAKDLRAAGLPEPDLPSRKSLWQRLTFAESASDYLGEILASAARGAGLSPANEPDYRRQLLATGHLSRYLWEKKFRAAMLED